MTPVLEHGARQRRAYLPSGADWADALDRRSNAECCGDCCSDTPGNDPRILSGTGHNFPSWCRPVNYLGGIVDSFPP